MSRNRPHLPNVLTKHIPPPFFFFLTQILPPQELYGTAHLWRPFNQKTFLIWEQVWIEDEFHTFSTITYYSQTQVIKCSSCLSQFQREKIDLVKLHRHFCTGCTIILVLCSICLAHYDQWKSYITKFCIEMNCSAGTSLETSTNRLEMKLKITQFLSISMIFFFPFLSFSDQLSYWLKSPPATFYAIRTDNGCNNLVCIFMLW